MHFDILFLDACANKYYDRITLEKEALGGSEASAIRVAEGLAGFGLKVAIMQTRKPYFEPTMGQHCFFIHADDAENVTCKHYIQMRTNANTHMFPKAKKYIWLHDAGGPDVEGTWLRQLIDEHITLICVSKWHQKRLKKLLPTFMGVEYIYNPVPDEIFVHQGFKPSYNPNLLVWTSSPHKGLGKALEVFKKIRDVEPKMQLIVFNPGYHSIDHDKLITTPGVAVYGPMNCRSVWNTVQQALCVLYPTEYEETFGLVAAEANALGVPLATHRVAALAETVSSDTQFFTDGEALIAGVLDWSKNGRPEVYGQDQFRIWNVIKKWIELLAR